MREPSFRIRARRLFVRRASARPADGGQSIVELAILLPIVLTVVVGALDLSRAYERQIKLEGAVRNAAERIARDIHVGDATTALTNAKPWICLAMDLPAGCTTVTVTVPAFQTPASATSTTPTTVTITATLPFSTLVPYPFLSTEDGAFTLRASSAYSFIRVLAP